MTYPNTPGFEAHSETSREAAALLTSRGNHHTLIVNALMGNQDHGATAEELADAIGAQRSDINARLRELELMGRVVKTGMTRTSSANRQQSVYVHPSHFKEDMGRGAVKERPVRGEDVKTMVTVMQELIWDGHISDALARSRVETVLKRIGKL